MENENIPLLIIAVEPSEVITLENFFIPTNNPFFNLLKEPPYLRYSGWNLLTLDTPKIKQGKCWEVKNGERKTIRLYDDGTLVAIAHANSEFLGWGQSEADFQKNPRLNTLAVIEYITEFVEFYRQLLRNMTPMEYVRFKFGIKNSQIDNTRGIYLVSMPVDSPLYMSDKLTGKHELTGKLEKDFMIDISVRLNANDYTTKYVAFDLVSMLFIQFGITPDKIPYTKTNEKEKRFIDIERVKAGR